MKVNVCLVQYNSVFFDKESTTEKVKKLVIKSAASSGQLIVFPETCIPGYPIIGGGCNESLA